MRINKIIVDGATSRLLQVMHNKHGLRLVEKDIIALNSTNEMTVNR